MEKIRYSDVVSMGIHYILSDFPDKFSPDLDRFVKQAKRAAYRSAAYHGLSINELADFYVKKYN